VILGQFDVGEQLLNEALKTFLRVGDRALTGATLENVGIARGAVGDIAGARAAFTEALALFKEIGAARLASAIENNLAESEFRAGNALDAMRLSTDALTSGGTIGVAWRRALLLSNRSAYLIALERYAEARETAREALSMARTLDYATTMAWAMQHIAASYAVDPGAAMDELERAASLLGYADARVDALQMIREYTEQHEYDEAVASLRAALGEGRVGMLMSEGAAWNEDRAVAQALNTCS